jgi:hypothetical protein
MEKIKVFTFQKHYFSMWKIPAEKVEHEVNKWLMQNDGIEIRKIKHDSYQGIWFAPQLIISIYYQRKTNSAEPIN